MANAITNVVIGGGTGFVGSALVNAFKAIGSKVWVISRMPGPINKSWDDISSNGLPESTQVVINVAGQNVLDPFRGWSEGFKSNVIASRVKTTKVLADAIARNPGQVKCFITVSGVGYYPPSETYEYDEYWAGRTDEPVDPDCNFMVQLCKDWEGANSLPEHLNHIRRVIIRSGVVIGPGGGIIQQVYLPFFMGAGGPIGSGKQFFPWISLHDIVRMFVFSAQNDSVTGVLNGVSPHTITNKQFSSALGKVMWRPSLIPLPEFVVDTLFSKERAIIMTKGQKVIPKRPLELGFKYEYEEIQNACRLAIK